MLFSGYGCFTVVFSSWSLIVRLIGTLISFVILVEKWRNKEDHLLSVSTCLSTAYSLSGDSLIKRYGCLRRILEMVLGRRTDR